jgi:small-conductance mechanosensitive channel
LLLKKNTLCLDEPAPLFIVQGFGTSSVDIQFSVWAKRENFLNMRNSIYQSIKEAFDEQGIEIPFPHMSLYAGEASKPISFTVEPKEAPSKD